MGDEAEDEAETAAAPTEMANNAVESETQSNRAWGLDDGEDEGGGGDRRRLTPRRITVAAVVASLTAAAVASVMGFNYLRTESTPPTATPPLTVPVAPPPISPAPLWHLDGTYRIDIRNPEGIIREYDGTVRSMGDLGGSTITSWGAFKTECEPSGCTARYVKLDAVTHRNPALDEAGRKITHVDRWNGVEWESADGEGPNGGSMFPLECAGGTGSSTVEVWSTLSPLPDGSFRGTTYRSEIPNNACGELPLGRQEVPTTATRIGDIPPGIF